MAEAATSERGGAGCWLVAGASGMVGRCLLQRLAASYPPVRTLALSRGDPPAWAVALPAVGWRRGDLYRDHVVEAVDTLLSAGPLDGLVACLERQAPPGLRRVVALSSTSVHAKAGSPEARERELAARLADAEARLGAWCAAAGVRWTLLRPTLIYDDHGGGALGALARLRRRCGCVLLPATALGRRQPVHADDVAAAMLAAAVTATCADRAYDLSGGEAVAYLGMVRRYLARDGRAARAWTVPPRAFSALAALARRLGIAPEATEGVLARLDADLVFDPGAAARDFGYAPRGFAPVSAPNEPSV